VTPGSDDRPGYPRAANLAQMSHQGSSGMRTALGGYALDLADELDKRAGRRQDNWQEIVVLSI
jgi:hypothetical protein